MKLEINALTLAYKREDTPIISKVLIGVIVAYAFSPVDLIPDFIPILGYLDDLILLPILIFIAIKLIPEKIMEECRVEARNDKNNERQKNWIAGGVIIFIWCILSVVIIRIILRSDIF